MKNTSHRKDEREQRHLHIVIPYKLYRRLNEQAWKVEATKSRIVGATLQLGLDQADTNPELLVAALERFDTLMGARQPPSSKRTSPRSTRTGGLGLIRRRGR
jgi:hypothetical protein